MQSPSKISRTCASAITLATCGLQGWADLPEGLLHSIVPLLCSILDLFAFAGTCHSWRAAFSSYPSKSTLCTLLPPLVFQPDISVHVRHDGQNFRMCQVVDPANSRSTLCCQIPEVAFEKFYFAGSSYGQLICSRGRNCFVVDVFTGAKVLPPQLPFGDDANFYDGMLTAPLASPNSHLLVWAVSDGQYLLLDWLIGSDSWSKVQLDDGSLIEQIVELNGQFIAMDSKCRVHTLSWAPQLGLQDIAIVWPGNVDECPFSDPLLVVCRDMLLVNGYLWLSILGAPINYEAYRLDMSTEPATCVEVVKLENDALFIGVDGRSPPFSCTSPGRWGGRSNCLYCVHPSKPWVLYRLNNLSRPPRLVLDTDPYIKPFWVYPSMLYSDGQ